MKINEISIRVTKIKGARPPRLIRGRPDPAFHKIVESHKLLIHIRHFEFENRAFVACGQGRAGDALLLRFGRKDRKHSCICWELGIYAAAHARRNAQDLLIELN